MMRNVLDAKINVLLDTEAKVAILGEVFTSQFVFLNFEATLQNLLSLQWSKLSKLSKLNVNQS